MVGYLYTGNVKSESLDDEDLCLGLLQAAHCYKAGGVQLWESWSIEQGDGLEVTGVGVARVWPHSASQRSHLDETRIKRHHSRPSRVLRSKDDVADRLHLAKCAPVAPTDGGGADDRPNLHSGRIHPDFRRPPKDAQTLWAEAKIPPWGEAVASLWCLVEMGRSPRPPRDMPRRQNMRDGNAVGRRVVAENAMRPSEAAEPDRRRL